MSRVGIAALLCIASSAYAEDPAPPVTQAPTQTLAPTHTQAPTQSEVAIVAPEPRYVAPTRRDRIGRIWAPVMIDGKGPFRLALDTAASRSGVAASVATALGIPLDQAPRLMLRGVTGSVAVPSIRVSSLMVGDLALKPVTLPIVTDALGGAEGVLGTEGLGDMRIFIDFQHDFISITHSRRQRATADFKVIPMLHSSLGLVVVDISVGGIAAKGIIDTGGQVTVGNAAMLHALRAWPEDGEPLLYATSDLPYVTAATVTDFVKRVPPQTLGVALSEHAAYVARFPGAPVAGITLAGERVVNGGVFMIPGGSVASLAAIATQFFDARKRPWQMAGLVGAAVLLRFVFRCLSIVDLERRAHQTLGVEALGVRNCAPELAFDVDGENEYGYARAHE